MNFLHRSWTVVGYQYTLGAYTLRFHVITFSFKANAASSETIKSVRNHGFAQSRINHSERFIILIKSPPVNSWLRKLRYGFAYWQKQPFQKFTALLIKSPSVTSWRRKNLISDIDTEKFMCLSRNFVECAAGNS